MAKTIEELEELQYRMCPSAEKLSRTVAEDREERERTHQLRMSSAAVRRGNLL